jgi:DnaJ-class molecular chaperone
METQNPGCVNCKGTCIISEELIIKIRIEKGTSHGSFIKLDGMGEQPQKKGEIPGDLLFQILVRPHPFFNREGNNLVYNQNLTFKESIVGKTILVPHFDEDISIYTGNFGVINPNRTYRIINKGLAGKGDIVLIFNIEYPEKKYDEGLIECKIIELIRCAETHIAIKINVIFEDNTSFIPNNFTDNSSNITNITDNTSNIIDITDNTSNIIDNTSNIINITDNTSNITDNTSNIVDNTSNIVDNTSNIVDNTSNIVDNTSNIINITDNTSNITDNTSNSTGNN